MGALNLAIWDRLSGAGVEDGPPLWSGHGTRKTVKAGFWPWLEPFGMRKSVKIFKLPWIWVFGIGHQGLGVRVDHRCGADIPSRSASDRAASKLEKAYHPRTVW